MKWLPISQFGEYLVLRKRDIEKKAFFDAINCSETDSFSVQNILYEVLCASGSSTREMYEAFCKSYDGEIVDEATFLSNYFGIGVYKESIKDFLKDKRECDECFYVDATLVDGYSFSNLLDCDDDDSTRFVEQFAKAVETL